MHYNFPGFSVGEVGGRPGPGRREIDHGALVRRALLSVLPKREEFPYAIRLVRVRDARSLLEIELCTSRATDGDVNEWYVCVGIDSDFSFLIAD